MSHLRVAGLDDEGPLSVFCCEGQSVARGSRDGPVNSALSRLLRRKRPAVKW